MIYEEFGALGSSKQSQLKAVTDKLIAVRSRRPTLLFALLMKARADGGALDDLGAKQAWQGQRRLRDLDGRVVVDDNSFAVPGDQPAGWAIWLARNCLEHA